MPLVERRLEAPDLMRRPWIEDQVPLEAPDRQHAEPGQERVPEVTGGADPGVSATSRMSWRRTRASAHMRRNSGRTPSIDLGDLV
jgi:hypothetical protein